MSISEALHAIKTEFERQFDVEISIYISIHRTSDGLEPSREHAERIIQTVANEIGEKKITHNARAKDDFATAWVSTGKDDIQITAFYPYSEYHTEGNNARESGT